MYKVIFSVCISQTFPPPDSNPISTIREQWRWCVLCQNAVTIWWMWADSKDLRWDIHLFFRLTDETHITRCYSESTTMFLYLFQGKITAQGKLLQQDTFSVSEQESGLVSRAKERRVFLFEQLVMFSEPIDKKKGFSLPGYTFKNSIKVRLKLCFSDIFETSCLSVLVNKPPTCFRSAVWAWRSSLRKIHCVWCWPPAGLTAAWHASSCKHHLRK